MFKALINLVAGAILAAVLSVSASAQDVGVEDTIRSQIEAFKADDFEQAFTYATPRLQQLFQSPQNFQRMVTNGYPMVWRPAEVDYLEQAEQGGAVYQKVRIIDQQGAVHLLLYRMEQTPDGWRIGGVQILDAPDATV